MLRPACSALEVQGVLEEQGQQVQHPEEGDGREGHDEGGGPEQPVPEEAQVEEGVGAAQLDGHCGGQQHGADRDPGEDPSVAPPDVGSLGDPVHEQTQSQARQHEARKVEAGHARGALVGEKEEAEGRRHHPDGHVHVEHPAPRQVGDEQAADDRTEGRCQGGRQDQQSRRPDSLGRGEHPEQHGQPDGGHQAPTDALEHPEGHQLAQAAGQSAQRRRQCEDDDGAEQHPPGAEAIAEPRRRRDEDSQADQEGDDRGGDTGGGGVEVPCDRR